MSGQAVAARVCWGDNCKPVASGDALRQTGISAGASRPLHVDADASSLLQAVGLVASGDAQRFFYKALDHTGLPAACDERCQAIMVMVSRCAELS